MSLTIAKGTKTIKIKGANLELATVYGWLDISSSVGGKINSALRFYEDQASFDAGSPSINVDIEGGQIVTDVPADQEPKLSISEAAWKTQLETDGDYAVTINA